MRAISLNGVAQVHLRGNTFKAGNITDNLCACCVVVETGNAGGPLPRRCSGVVVSA